MLERTDICGLENVKFLHFFFFAITHWILLFLYFSFSFWKCHVNYYILLRVLGFLSFLSELLNKITFANSLCSKYGLNLHEIILQVSESTCQG
jgi:hypothetical protein